MNKPPPGVRRLLQETSGNIISDTSSRNVDLSFLVCFACKFLSLFLLPFSQVAAGSRSVGSVNFPSLTVRSPLSIALAWCREASLYIGLLAFSKSFFLAPHSNSHSHSQLILGQVKQIMSPPASISGSTGSSTTFASDHDESRYLDKTRWLRLLRLGLAGATMAVSLVAVALESHSLREYHRTSAYAKWWLDLWPARLDQRPSVASIACGVIIFAMAAGYIVAAMLPSVRPCSSLHPI
jgi:hypothetical protein